MKNMSRRKSTNFSHYGKTDHQNYVNQENEKIKKEDEGIYSHTINTLWIQSETCMKFFFNAFWL